MAAWLLHDTGRMKTGRLAGRLKSRHLEQARGELGLPFSRYVPWMSNVENLRHILPLLNPDVFSIDGQLVTDAATLRQLAILLDIPGRHPLALLVDADIEASIMDDVCESTPGALHLFEEAKDLLRASSGWVCDLFGDVIDCVIPIRHYVDGLPVKRAFSSHSAYGAIFITFEEREANDAGYVPQLAIDLAHELGHHALNTFQRADRILASDLEAPVYSAVRKTIRPAIMSFHACVALAYMLEVSSAISICSSCSDEQRLYASQVAAEMARSQECGLAELSRSCQFTELGSKMYQEMRDHLEAYRAGGHAVGKTT